MPNSFDFDNFLTQVQNQTAQDWVAERKRLREARVRWIEENECPTGYGVKLEDGSTFNTPFQVGKLRYEGEYPDQPIPATRPLDEDSSKSLLDGVDAAFNNQSGVLSISEGGMFRPDEKSAHPEIREGEEYGEYVKRVGSAYERQTNSSTRNPTPSDGSVRRDGKLADSSRSRLDDRCSSGGSERERSELGSITEPVRQDDSTSATGGSGDADAAADDITH